MPEWDRAPVTRAEPQATDGFIGHSFFARHVVCIDTAGRAFRIDYLDMALAGIAGRFCWDISPTLRISARAARDVSLFWAYAILGLRRLAVQAQPASRQLAEPCELARHCRDLADDQQRR